MDAELLEGKIAALIEAFQAAPLHFFSEHALHGRFYALCHTWFGVARPSGCADDVPLFHHEYNTLTRHRRARGAGSHGTSFRHPDATGAAGSLDFAILNPSFVTDNRLLSVINKDESRRARQRSSQAQAQQSHLAAGIEFKMAHLRDGEAVSESAIRRLERGLREDARKLKHERPFRAYVLAFSHSPGLSAHRAREMLLNATFAFAETGEASGSATTCMLAVTTPEHTYLHGAWLRDDMFARGQRV